MKVFSALSIVTVMCLAGVSLAHETNRVLVTVNGTAFTVAEADLGVDLRMKLFARSQVKSNVFGLKQDQAQFEQSKNQYRQTLMEGAVGGFVRTCVLKHYATANGLEVQKESLKKRLESTAQRFKYRDYGEMKKDLTDKESCYFERTIRDDLLCELAEHAMKKSIDASVSEEDLNEAFDRLRQINETAWATNRLVWLRATNIYNQVKSGKLDFQAAVTKYSEQDPKEADGFFTRLPVADILKNDEKIGEYMVLKKPKVGDVFPPLQGDNGVVICRFADQERDQCELHVVYLRLAQDWKIPTRDELRGILSSNKITAGYRKMFEDESKKCHIEFSPTK